MVDLMILIVSSRSSTARATRSEASACSMKPCGALQGHPGGEQPLNGQVVQIAGDPVTVLEHRDLLGVRTALRELHRDRGLRGEALEGLDLLVGERDPARLAREQDDPADPVGARSDRHPDSGSQSPEALRGRRDPLVLGDVRAGHRGRGGERVADETGVHREHEPQVGRGSPSHGKFHGERVGVLHGRGYQGEGGAGVLPGPVRDQPEDLRVRAARHQAVGDLGVGPQPALAQPGVLVEAGVVDGDAAWATASVDSTASSSSSNCAPPRFSVR